MARPASDAPRIRVAALMSHNGKVVLARHRAGSSTYHLLPGGGVDYRETLEEALVREIREETGFEARIGAPLFISDTIDPEGSRHVVNITFLADIVGGHVLERPRDHRVQAVDLVSPDDLARLDLRPPMGDLIAAVLRTSQPPALQYLGSLFTPERRP